MLSDRRASRNPHDLHPNRWISRLAGQESRGRERWRVVRERRRGFAHMRLFHRRRSPTPAGSMAAWALAQRASSRNRAGSVKERPQQAKWPLCAPPSSAPQVPGGRRGDVAVATSNGRIGRRRRDLIAFSSFISAARIRIRRSRGLERAHLDGFTAVTREAARVRCVKIGHGYLRTCQRWCDALRDALQTATRPSQPCNETSRDRVSEPGSAGSTVIPTTSVIPSIVSGYSESQASSNLLPFSSPGTSVTHIARSSPQAVARRAVVSFPQTATYDIPAAYHVVALVGLNVISTQR
jgi:hypothetical protein